MKACMYNLYMYVYTRIYIHVYTNLHMHSDTQTHKPTHIYIYTYSISEHQSCHEPHAQDVYICICLYMYSHIHIYTPLHIYIYTYNTPVHQPCHEPHAQEAGSQCVCLCAGGRKCVTRPPPQQAARTQAMKSFACVRGTGCSRQGWSLSHGQESLRREHEGLLRDWLAIDQGTSPWAAGKTASIMPRYHNHSQIHFVMHIQVEFMTHKSIHCVTHSCVEFVAHSRVDFAAHLHVDFVSHSYVEFGTRECLCV